MTYKSIIKYNQRNNPTYSEAIENITGVPKNYSEITVEQKLEIIKKYLDTSKLSRILEQ